MRYCLCIVSAWGAILAAPAIVGGAEPDPTHVFRSWDSRLEPAKTLRDYFPFIPPSSRAAWETRKRELREQVLVANGLWPMPEKTPLRPVVHSQIDRDGYTVEKVFFASYPGHYVCGNLYRPKGRAGKLPGVLCPHGHWSNGRFYDAGEKAAKLQIDQGAEQTMAGARHPMQARCAQLARMGCVVFLYDMVGYADSQQIPHRAGFKDAEAELRLQNFMGLQTYNSIRALDFLLSLPDVDAQRIGVTGASGGGTQTFLLAAVDDRPTVAFPAVMVSTAMQGGCVCENCSYLRVDSGNIELAGLFAPKPLGMTGARDWTIDIETKGLPELKALYRLYDAEDKVMAKCFPQFGHNYNQVSREVMYDWFNKHLGLGVKGPIKEQPFEPLTRAEMTVFDAEHPLPSDAVDAAGLRKYLTELDDRQLAALSPKDAKSWQEFQRIIGTALRVMVNDRLPAGDQVAARTVGPPEERHGARWQRLILGRAGANEQVPAVRLQGKEFNGTVVLWVHPDGKSTLLRDGKLSPDAARILESKAAILALDVLGTGEFGTWTTQPVNADYAGYTYGYNRTLLANRVHDILTALAYARNQEDTTTLHLIGFDKAGPWVVLARALSGDAVTRTAANLNSFRFEQVQTTADEMMLPGALKYGGLPAFAALCAPGELYLHGTRDTGTAALTKAAYAAAGQPDRLRQSEDQVSPARLIAWLLP
ncbi:MAG: alpha/beta hydrolase family protein [Gemmataceae bacterium]